MYFASPRWHKIEDCRTVEGVCENCSNPVALELYFAKEGPGLSLPFTPFFTDKYTLAMKFFYLVCPICNASKKVSRDTANKIRGI